MDACRSWVLLLARYSMNKAFAPYSAAGILAGLEERGLFQQMGSAETET